MTSPVRLGAVVLPEHDWDRTRRIWSRLEEIGLHHGWSFDHHSWRTLRDEPWYDSPITLASVAAVTSRIRLGTLVATPNFRDPVVLAKQVMTLDEVSGGRFVLGIGAGGPGADAQLLGGRPLSARARSDRFAEFVELSDLLLRNRSTTYHGEHFHAVDARMQPGCRQRPRVPFAIAASGARGLALAARHADMWVTIGDTREPGSLREAESWQLIKEQVRLLEQACEQEGRDSWQLPRLAYVSRILDNPLESVERFLDAVGRCRDLGFTDVVVNHPRRTGVFSGTEAAFERAVLAALAAP
jgi:alkanesulfonate monooxygenase SsuD/methylene tetrahydromethanopterin reductase-like flavin-dependent oxidoreductase (luciferase family)